MPLITDIKLQSNDDRIFTVDLKVIDSFKTIKTMVDNLGADDSDEFPIPLMKVNGSTFEKMIEWAEYHRNDAIPPQTEEEEHKSRELCEWDKNFFKMDRKTLFEIILAANYLDAKELLEAACGTVADMIKGKSVEQIRDEFHIQSDFTPEEEERIKLETSWCEEA